MTDYTDHLRDLTEQTLARTAPTEAELAEAAERAKRNRMARIMAPTAVTLPATQLQRTSEAPAGEYATKKWVNRSFDNLTKATLHGLDVFAKKLIRPLQAEVEQGRKASEAIGRQVDKIVADLAELKREAMIEKKLEEVRTARRMEMLELENSLLKAGRNPAPVEAEAEIPKMEWNGHAS